MASPTGYGRRRYRAYVPHSLVGWDLRLGPESVSAVTRAPTALDSLASLPETHLGTAIADWVIAPDESIRSSVMEGVLTEARYHRGPLRPQHQRRNRSPEWVAATAARGRTRIASFRRDTAASIATRGS